MSEGGKKEESASHSSNDSDRPGVRETFARWIVPRIGGREWRLTLAWFLLVLGCILLPLAVLGGWVRGSVFDTDGFVDTLGPLASEPAIQVLVAERVTDSIYEGLDVEQQLREVLPGRLGIIAGPVVDQMRDWTEGLALRFVASDQFQTIWTAALRGVHGQVVGFLDGSGRVVLGPEGVIYLDLSPLAIRLVERLEGAGISVSEERFPVVTSGQVPLVQVERLSQVRPLLSAVNTLFIVLPVMAVFFLVASVVVSPARRRAALRAGIGIMISMAVFLVILAFGRTAFMNAAEAAEVSTEAAATLWGGLTIALRGTAWALFFVGLLILIHPHIVGVLRGDLMTRAAGGAAAAGWNTGRVGAWAAARRRLLTMSVLIIGVLVLVLWPQPGLAAVISIAVVVIVVEAAVLFLARQSELSR